MEELSASDNPTLVPTTANPIGDVLTVYDCYFFISLWTISTIGVTGNALVIHVMRKNKWVFISMYSSPIFGSCIPHFLILYLHVYTVISHNAYCYLIADMVLCITLSAHSYIMMTSSNGNIFRVTGHLCGEFTGPGEFPTQRPVTRSFDVYFDLCPNKRLSKQSWGWWFGTLSCSLWRHRNDHIMDKLPWKGIPCIYQETHWLAENIQW